MDRGGDRDDEPERDARLVDAVADWWDRRSRGEADATGMVLRAFPDLADALGATLSALERSEVALAVTRDGGSASQPFADFRILREIGCGGMGVVFEAEQLSMRRLVALKVLHPAVVLEPHAVERFRREARAAGRIHHTHLVPVYAIGEDRGRWYYAMELVRGRTLSEVIRDLRELRTGPPGANTPAFPTAGTNGSGAVPAARDFYARVAFAFAGVADALRTAHQAGVIHRDVKPSNLILGEDGTLKLMDFGLARPGGDATSITVTGAALGTPAYMSPEQVRGAPHPIDGRTDVWSLGATLYELLTLRAPFLGSAAQIFPQILSRDPPTPRSLNPRIPKDLETIVAKALEKDPERRYRTAADLAHDLASFGQGEQIRAQRPGVAARAWRRVRRRPALSLVAAGLAIALAAAVILGLDAQREGRARRRAEYDLLLLRAVGATPGYAAGTRGQARNEAAHLYDDAVRLDPDRLDAYVARALDGTRSVEERLRDAEDAAARGLAPATAALLREWVQVEGGKAPSDDEVARLVAAVGPTPEALVRLVAGAVAARRGDDAEAERQYAAVLAEPSGPSLVAVLARLRRITVRIRTSAFAGALDDVHALAGMGITSVRGSAVEAWLWRRLGNESEAEARFAGLLARSLQSEHDTLELADACEALPARGWLDRTTERGVAAFGSSAGLWALRAAALDLGGHLEEAQGAWKRAIDLRPDDAFLVGRWAQTLANLGQRDLALAESARAVAMAPGDARILANRADVCRGLGRIEEGIAAAEAAVRLDPRSVGGFRTLGTLRANQGRLREADDALGRALRLSPADGLTLFALGRLRYFQKDLRGSLEAFDRSIAADPEAPERHLLRGSVLRALRREPEAEQAFLRALALRPDLEDAEFRLGMLLCDTGRRDEGVRRLRAAVKAKPDHAEAWLELGNALRLDPPDVDGAVAAYETARKVRPGMWEAEVNLAAVLLDAHRPEEALPILAKAVETHPRDAALRFNLGVALLQLGRADEALAAFVESARLHPDDVDARLEIAKIHLAAGRPKEAVAEIERAAQVDPRSAVIQHDFAVARWQAGDLAGAEEAARRSTELDGKYADGHAVLSGILHARGDDVASAREAEIARTLAPDRFGLWKEAAAALVDVGKPGAAADLYVQAAERFPAEGEAQFLAAWMLVTAEDPAIRAPEKAAIYARRAVALDEKSGIYRAALGVALYRQERYAEAIRTLEEARAADDADPCASYFLAMALHRTGKREEARAAFDRAVASRKATDAADRESLRFEAEAASVLGPP